MFCYLTPFAILSVSLGSRIGRTDLSFKRIGIAVLAACALSSAKEQSNDPPVPQWVLEGRPADDFVQHLNRAIMSGGRDMPSKMDDQWTVTPKFRQDLRQFFSDKQDFIHTCLEIGGYLGYTTRVLSEFCPQVISIDVNDRYQAGNAELNRDRKNVMYILADSAVFDYRSLRSNRIDVAFIDASHDFESTLADLERMLELGAKFLIFDDFAAEKGVNAAVNLANQHKRISHCVSIGERDFEVKDGRVIHGPEGVVCLNAQFGKEVFGDETKEDGGKKVSGGDEKGQ